ncbi:hypothetical protein [Rhodohalobacter halophilus]|uniref:hypothetical protein n=1 Tax=Rhodohalobacter halophilus TaxID=1812810 RepID=UPI00083FA7FB|nr:hypothetical protein [Rhodohalobacter halophilus]
MNNQFDIGLKIMKTGLVLVVIKDLIYYLILAEFYFGKDGIVPFKIYESILESIGLSFLEVLFSNIYGIYVFLLFSLFIAFLFLFDRYNLITGLLLFICLTVIRLRNLYIMDSGDTLYTLLIFFLAFYTPGQREVKTESIGTYPIALAVKLQISLVYLFSGLWKLKGEMWLQGQAVYHILQVEDFSMSGLSDYLIAYPVLPQGLTYFTILFEIGFPFLIWLKSFRLPLIVMGLMLHVGIFILMRIDNFSLVMILSYFTMVSDREYIILKENIKHYIGYAFPLFAQKK